MYIYQSTKVITLGSCAFRQPNAAFNRKDAGNNSQRCSKLHGYRLKAKFWFGCSHLDDKSWVQDFGGLKPIKELFEHQFDHTTCLSFDDPLLPLFKELDEKGGLDLRIMPEGTGIEKIAKFCFEKMQEFINTQSDGRCWVEKVEVFEHEDNSAIYGLYQAANTKTVPLATEEKTIDAVVPAEAPAHVHQQHGNTHTNGARVGSHVSQGMGNPFAGTSWGN